MTTFPFHTTVLDNGMLAAPLPEEFRGGPVDVVVLKKSTPLPLPGCSSDFGQKKSLDEIVVEQGGPRVCTNPASLWEGFPTLWDTEAELEEFLERRKY